MTLLNIRKGDWDKIGFKSSFYHNLHYSHHATGSDINLLDHIIHVTGSGLQFKIRPSIADK